MCDNIAHAVQSNGGVSSSTHGLITQQGHKRNITSVLWSESDNGRGVHAEQTQQCGGVNSIKTCRAGIVRAYRGRRNQGVGVRARTRKRFRGIPCAHCITAQERTCRMACCVMPACSPQRMSHTCTGCCPSTSRTTSRTLHAAHSQILHVNNPQSSQHQHQHSKHITHVWMAESSQSRSSATLVIATQQHRCARTERDSRPSLPPQHPARSQSPQT